MHKHFSCLYHSTHKKNKEPSVTSNVPKALYFCGFAPILFFLFVSIKRVLFRYTCQVQSSSDEILLGRHTIAFGFPMLLTVPRAP